MISRKASKEILADSLTDLLKTESFEKISVSQIAENCGIAKRTFYYHFHDKYELALWIYIHQLDDYYALNKGNVTLHSFIAYSADVLWKDRYVILNMSRYLGQNNFRYSVYEPLADRYLYLIEHTYGDEITDELRSAVTFFVGGMITYVEHGLRMQAIPPPEKGVAVFEACLPRAMLKYLDAPLRGGDAHPLPKA